MNKRTVLLTAAAIIVTATLILFAVNQFVQPTLPAPWNGLLIALGVAAGVALVVMSGIADTLQVTNWLWGRQEREGEAPNSQARVDGGGAAALGAGSKAVGQGALDASHSQVGGSIFHHSQIEAGGSVVGGDQYIQIAQLVVNQPGPDQEKILVEALGRYLYRLSAWCNALPLVELGSSDAAETITLEQVYIDLDTETRLEEKDERQRGLPGLDEEKRLSALAAVTQYPRLVLLGDPGSGKSSFVQRLAGWLARSGRGEAPPPEGWTPLLPLFVRLRDLAPALAQLKLTGLSGEAREQKLAGVVIKHWQESLRHEWREPALADALETWLQAGQVLLIFDGLDEVAESVRAQAPLAARAVLRTYPKVERVIVTCRVRSYTGAAVMSGFHSERLAPFSKQKIHAFIEAWYAAQMSLTSNDQKARISDLQRAATEEDLIRLAENPMLLTTMAIIHQQQTRLPRQRARVYDEAVKILLYRWQRNKGLLVSPALQKALEDPRRLRQILERLGYEAHQRQATALGGRDKAADLPRSALLILLEEQRYLGDVGLASEFLDYVDQRSGLLVGYGGDIAGEKPQLYSFAHRTFQEYLAGCHMLADRDPKREYLRRLQEGDYWYLAAQLGAEELLYVRRGESGVLDLAYALCPVAEPANAAHWRGVVLSGHLANLVGRTEIEADEIQDGGPAYLTRVQARLTRALAVEELTPIERAEGGRHLAQLGDMRRAILTTAAMPFCYVPAGPFWLGSDEISADEKPAGEVELPYAYWLGQYPVSQAQYAEFTAAGGYKEANYWLEAAEKGYWRDGRFKGRFDSDWRSGPYGWGHPYNLPNHPVVGATWYEAAAFCRWLTERWQAKGKLPAGWRIQLPSEIEWEKGARGGLEIPTESVVMSLEEDAWRPELVLPLTKNEMPQRPFPWGEADLTPDRANYQETGLRKSSAIGCFPTNVSPVGCVEMSGNVWEWTRSKYMPYPYQPQKAEQLDSSDDWRVIRGGSWGASSKTLRCAYRLGLHPYHRLDHYGFRVCASPFPYPHSDR